jgi:hypothetical protein
MWCTGFFPRVMALIIFVDNRKISRELELEREDYSALELGISLVAISSLGKR